MQWVLTDIPLGRNSMMSRSTLANIEAGRRNIKASDLKALKVLFDVDYAAFFMD